MTPRVMHTEFFYVSFKSMKMYEVGKLQHHTFLLALLKSSFFSNQLSCLGIGVALGDKDRLRANLLFFISKLLHSQCEYNLCRKRVRTNVLNKILQKERNSHDLCQTDQALPIPIFRNLLT